MTQPPSGVVRVRLPAVVVPPGDVDGVRLAGTRLCAAGADLAEVGWRLRADGAAMSASRRWCGVASAAYQGAAAGHCDHVTTSGRVLQVAGQACLQYARSLDQAQAQARRAARRVDRLVRECDDLDAAWRRYESGRIAAAASWPTPVQAGAVLAAAPAADAEMHRLRSWADSIAAAATHVAADAAQAGGSARAAAADAAQVFDALASLTTAARAAAGRARHDALVAAGVLAAEDGSAGSRVAGLVDALREDVTGPLGTIGGLLGADGDVGQHWSDLGRGVANAFAHPGDLLGVALDTRDAGQGDWGHWLGSVLPGALLSAGSGGAYAVARGIRSADLLVSSARVADELRRAQELLDLADWAQFRFANGGRTTSRLVPGGGLIWHEAAGGHALDRHVGLDLADLRRRIARYRVAAASSFTDRYAAEQLVAEAMERQARNIATWLGTDEPEVALLTEMRRVVGTTVRKGSRFVEEATRIKVVLVREPDSAVGFILLTAFPLP